MGVGQVAQLVEQGTENPRVGGSIPSLATIPRWGAAGLLAALLAGCGTDSCAALCTSVASRIDACRAEWGASWEDFGANSRREMRVDCQDEWDATRADLEAREIPAADDQCDDAQAELDSLGCDELRALYL